MALIDNDMPDMEIPQEPPMDEKELAAIVRSEIENSINFSETEYEESRTEAMKYYCGDITIAPLERGRSSVVSHDVADVIGEIMPSLMRVFFSGGKIVVYEPSTEEEEEYSEQATDYINYLFEKRCDGYNVLWDAFHDGLLHRNGIITYYYDNKPTFNVYNYTRLSEEQLAQLEADPDVQIRQATIQEEVLTNPETGQQIVVPFYDVQIRRVKERGRVKIESVPPEEFLINREAESIADARFVARRYLTTRSDLRLEGYDWDQIKELPTYSNLEFSQTRTERLLRSNYYTANSHLDESQEDIQVYDCYLKIDIDKDGIAEWVNIVIGGSTGTENTILAVEEWHDEVPFTDLTPERVPHRWQGRSIFDETHDIQLIKTVLMRNTLDSTYVANNPTEFVQESQIVDPDELLSRELGRRVRTKGPPQAAVHVHQLPFIGNHTFPMLEYLDAVSARRTGVSIGSQALDADTLQNQSATAANLAASTQYSKIELIARNYAEQLRRTFRALLKLVVENVDRPEIIRLRGKFVEFNPRSWNADMDCTVNTGLGTGSRDRDMMALQMVAADQDKYIDNLGPNNPYVSLDERVETSRKMVAAAGLQNPETYFNEATPEEIQAYQQMMAEQANQPTPEQQAEIQVEQIKTAGDVEKERAQMEADLATQAAEMEAKSISEAEERQTRIMLNEQNNQLEREKMAMQAEEKAKDRMAQAMEAEKDRQARIAIEAMKINAKVPEQMPPMTAEETVTVEAEVTQ